MEPEVRVPRTQASSLVAKLRLLSKSHPPADSQRQQSLTYDPARGNGYKCVLFHLISVHSALQHESKPYIFELLLFNYKFSQISFPMKNMLFV